jgi:hypothetical protein
MPTKSQEESISSMQLTSGAAEPVTRVLPSEFTLRMSHNLHQRIHETRLTHEPAGKV